MKAEERITIVVRLTPEFDPGQVVRFRYAFVAPNGREIRPGDLGVVRMHSPTLHRPEMWSQVTVTDLAGHHMNWLARPEEIEPVEGSWWEGQRPGFSFWLALGFEAHFREAFGIEGDPYRITLPYSHVSVDDRPDWAPREPHRFVTYIGGEKWFKEEKVVLQPWLGVPGVLAAGYGPESDMVIFVEHPKG